jgi:hypothetical protein
VIAGPRPHKQPLWGSVGFIHSHRVMAFRRCARIKFSRSAVVVIAAKLQAFLNTQSLRGSLLLAAAAYIGGLTKPVQSVDEFHIYSLENNPCSACQSKSNHLSTGGTPSALAVILMGP